MMKNYGLHTLILLITIFAQLDSNKGPHSKTYQNKKKATLLQKKPTPQCSPPPQKIYTTADLITHVTPLENKRFVFIAPGYNNANWVERMLLSIFTQNYSNYHIICIDDASTDDSVLKIKTCISAYKKQDKITLIENKERQGMMANRYNAIYMCNDNDICIILDGDDWLFPDPEILNFYNQVYSDQNIWLTFGQFVEYPSGKIGYGREYSFNTIRKNAYRKEFFGAQHLRTFYAWLFKLVHIESFIHKGSFIRFCTDHAILYPMLEMAGFHAVFLSKITCVYNRCNPLSGCKKSTNDGNDCSAWVKAQTPYQPLTNKPEIPLKINNYKKIASDGFIGVNG